MKINPLTIAAEKTKGLGHTQPDGQSVVLEIHTPNGCLIRLSGDMVGEQVVFSTMFLTGIGSRGKARARNLKFLKNLLDLGATYEFCNLDSDP